MLGTVQFGVPYGIANTAGQVPYTEVLSILKNAYEGGVNCLDTAAGYGTSEVVLGRALRELSLKDKMTVVTKCAWQPEGLNAAQTRDHVRSSVQKSQEALGLEQLPLCLIHREQDFSQMEYLEELVQEGAVLEAGISVSTPQATLDILSAGRASALQLAASILDHRFRMAGTAQQSNSEKCSIFVRSIYLQGLLLMPEHNVPSHLAAVLPTRTALRQLAQHADMTLEELAVRYMLSQTWISSIVVGVQSQAQMLQNLKWFALPPLDGELISAVEVMVPKFEDHILRPELWPRP